MQNNEVPHKKYVFVCGLHRSGTTLLARNLGKLDHSTVFENTGVIMDEGQFLQDVYPSDPEYGGAGLFGFNPAAHLTETSTLLTPENVLKLRASLQAHWNEEPICVEKTPGNLIMSRFLQKVFENAYFVAIKRHPVAVSLATQKWSRTSLHKLFEHWLRCHEIFEEDKPHLKHLYELTYEEYVENPDKCLAEIAAFIGTRHSERSMEKVTDHNIKYLDQWYNLLTRSVFKGYFRYIARRYNPKFVAHNYSLTEGFVAREALLAGSRGVSDVVGACACFIADVCAAVSRFVGLTKIKLARSERPSRGAAHISTFD